MSKFVISGDNLGSTSDVVLLCALEILQYINNLKHNYQVFKPKVSYHPFQLLTRIISPYKTSTYLSSCTFAGISTLADIALRLFDIEDIGDGATTSFFDSKYGFGHTTNWKL